MELSFFLHIYKIKLEKNTSLRKAQYEWIEDRVRCAQTLD